MKPLLINVVVGLLLSNAFGQVPQKMNYQAVIRNASNALVSNTSVGIRISILQADPTGVPVYVETQSPVANANGLVTLEIGGGMMVSGSFTDIDWSAGPYFIKSETDPTGGTNYTISGTSQLMSVPYALYAEKSGTPGDQGPPGANGISITWLGSLTVAPSSPSLNEAYYNSVDKKSYVFDGTVWQVLAQDGAKGDTGEPGFLSNGETAGNTPYWNGSSWILNSSNIYNNGGNIGIGTTTTPEKLSVGGNISLTGAINNEVIQAPTLLNGWANYSLGWTEAGFYKDKEGRVHLSGLVKGGPDDSVIFNLPAGYRPSGSLIFRATDGSTSSRRIDVESNGNVKLVGTITSIWISLSGISFRAN